MPPRPTAVEGRNCWRRVDADRVTVLIDGQAYYSALKATLLKARYSILLIGWEIDSRTALDRRPGASEPNTLAALLDHLARTRPTLRVRVLIWETPLIYWLNREWFSWAKFRWLTHWRVRFRADDAHPLSASLHQKIVVIDDSVAFLGGFDVTNSRWDSRDHLPADPRRSDPGFPTYPPFHDIMLMVSGPAAAALGELARARWRCALGRAAPPAPPHHDTWPEEIAPDLRDVTVAIARTMPSWEGEPEIREVEHLFLDMIVAAKRLIYIENQYFASRRIARALAARLQEEDCPEIVVVSCRDPVGLLERTAMGLSRARLYARLRKLDRYRRLRFYIPVVPGTDVKIHSKCMIIDDEMLRVGSANLNNRSLGLDKEADILIEALGDSAVEIAIRRLRLDLLAEHLGVEAAAVEQESARHGGSMIAAIEHLRGGERSLVPLDEGLPEDWWELVPGGVFDPETALEAEMLAEEEVLPSPSQRPFRRKAMLMAVLLGAIAALAALWNWAPLDRWIDLDPLTEQLRRLRAWPAAPLLAPLAFVLGGLLALPATLMIALAGALFGVWKGFVIALVGSMASAALLYGVGKLLGRDRVRRLAGRRVSRVSRGMVRHGIMAMAMLRLVPVAGFSLINLVAGAARGRFGEFLVGSFVGMLPIIFAFDLFGDRLAAVLRAPNVVNTAIMIALTAVLILAGLSLAQRVARAVPNRPPGETSLEPERASRPDAQAHSGQL